MFILNGLNYNSWAIKIRIFLKSQSLWNFIENGFVEPEDESTDTLVLYYIMKAMSDDIFYIVKNANTPKEVWENLKIHHGVRRSHTHCKAQSKDIEEKDVKFVEEENEVFKEDGVEDEEIKENHKKGDDDEWDEQEDCTKITAVQNT